MLKKQKIEMYQDFKFLVVDDTPELLDITAKLLRNAHYNVLTANTGAECLDVLQKEKPDILLLDVMLPDVNGRDLANQIKSNPEFSHVFIILLSSLKTRSEDISEGLEDGADLYIVRPVKGRELLAWVASACRIIRAERISSESLQKYHSLFSRLELGVFLQELIYDQNRKAIDFRILEANLASEKLLSIKAEDVVGKMGRDLYKIGEPHFLEIYAQVVETGLPATFDEYFESIGKYCNISVYSNEKGRFFTVFSDITDRKRIEKFVILRNEELKVNLAEKDKFFSIIAHDLRSPFNGFLGFTQILADDLQSLTMYELQKLTQSLRRSATNLFSLLSNLLEWSSMQRGLIAFSPEGYLLKPLLEESTEQLMETAKSKMISLNYQIADDLIVFADLNMFESIVRNLTSNAIKFTPKGGNIIISAKKVTDSMIEISVCDNGIGIPDEMIGDLFRLDVKTNRKGTDDEPSTGLGLILCQDFIKKNNGSISVVSKEGIGSTFSIRIPSGKI